MAIRIGITDLGVLDETCCGLPWEIRLWNLSHQRPHRCETLAYLLKYDSVHGTLGVSVEAKGIRFSSMASRSRCWPSRSEGTPVEGAQRRRGHRVDGRFTDREGAASNLSAGAKQVIISAPATDPD